MDREKIIKNILDIIRGDETLRNSIIIKGGMSISLLLHLDNRETKDIDTCVDNDSMEQVIEKMKNKIEMFFGSEIEIEVKENNRTPSIHLKSKTSLVDITFKEYYEKDGFQIADGLKVIKAENTVLDKIDRFSRLWLQHKSNTYEGIGNLFNGNYQRDLYDIFSLVGQIDLNNLINEY